MFNQKEKIINFESLSEIRKKHQYKKIVFCSGCFDILQSGHAVFFNQCKSFGDILVVGMGRDSIVSQLKGNSRPINPEMNRVYLVSSMQDVDYVTLNDNQLIEGKIDFSKIMTSLRPDIFVVNEDDSGLEQKKKLCNSLGTEFVTVKRIVPEILKPTSTTDIINKINYSLKSPLRIDFAGGWTDIAEIMPEENGYVSNISISPCIELKSTEFNFKGYPRGTGLSTSTATKVLELLNSKEYNSYQKNLNEIAEDLYILENKNLSWMIGRQDQYGIVHGGFNCFEFSKNDTKKIDFKIKEETLKKLKEKLLLIYTGVSRNAQVIVEEVYKNHKTQAGKESLKELANLGKRFAEFLEKENLEECGRMLELNWLQQIKLAPTSTNKEIDEIYEFAKKNGAIGGKLCGAGGGGCFIFYSDNPKHLKDELKRKFLKCFEIDFDFEYRDIKQLNNL